MITLPMRAIVLDGARPRAVWSMKCYRMIACLFLAVLLTTGQQVRGQGEWDDGFAWPAPRLDSLPRAITVFDDGTAPALYVGGSVTPDVGSRANNIARWNGSTWSALGSGVSDWVRALTVFDDGTGPALYVGGFFASAGGASANRIAKWNGSVWSPLGSGVWSPVPGVYGFVSALTVFDDGTGPALYAGGGFTTAGGVNANNIAKWNGSAWSPLGSGMNSSVFALTIFDDGSGPALYAGGAFTVAGGVNTTLIAKWNGSAWSPLGSGMNDYVGALTVFDDGTGPALYAGGHFTTAGGVSANHIAKWNGSVWSPLSSGMSGGSYGATVYTLTVFNEGTGPALYAGGGFNTSGGVSTNFIAKWNGTIWSPLGSGMNSIVFDLAVFDDGIGPALYAVGDFTTAGGKPSEYIAAWRPDCNGNGVPNGCDLICGTPCAFWSTMPGCGESGDCNANRVPDECDLAAGLADENRNGVLDACELLGDCDGNDIVALDDARIFTDCMTGPAVAVDVLDACRCVDLNGDGFIDLRDAALFMQLFGVSR